MADAEFVNGLIVKAPHENAPGFVKASISIKVRDLERWLQGKSDEWINVDVKESKGGKWYAAVSTYKPKKAGEQVETRTKPAEDFTGIDDDIPF